MKGRSIWPERAAVPPIPVGFTGRNYTSGPGASRVSDQDPRDPLWGDGHARLRRSRLHATGYLRLVKAPGVDAESGPKISFGPGLHAPAGQRVDVSAYEQYLGRWSRLFVPAVLTAAEVAGGERVLDVAVGPGEAGAIALAPVGPTGLVVGRALSRGLRAAARTR